MKVLVSAATKHGATSGISEAIAAVLTDRGFETTVVPPQEVVDVAEYDAVILGSAVYVGYWLEPATALVDRAHGALAARPVWVFSSGPVGDPARKLVASMGQDPIELPEVLAATRAREHRMFAGRLDKANLSLPQRAAVTLVRGLEGDFRDWADVRAWADGIADTLHAAAKPPRP